MHYFDSSRKMKLYTLVEIEPEFPGSSGDYQKFINRNLRVPQEMIDNEEPPPTVLLDFIVDTTGKIMNLSIKGKTDTTSYTKYEKAVCEMAGKMPPWEPGLCQNKKVPVKVTRPIIICVTIEGP